MNRPFEYVTFLRDPARRAISSYYENLKTNPGIFSNTDGSLMSLEHSLDTMPNFFANQQTKMISGNITGDELTETDLNLAIDNLKSYFAFIGITERFNESLLLLSKELNWRPCLYTNLNLGRENLEISEEALERATNLNSLDYHLYDNASGILNENISAQSDLFHEALSEWNTAMQSREDNPENQNSLVEFADNILPTYLKFLNG